MPPRYSYWTIIAGGLPTAFRAAERDELMPTFTRLRDKHPDAEMKFFARGKLWASPEAAREELEARRDPGAGRDRDRTGPRSRSQERGAARSGDSAKRERDWRPGGEHRDPRQKYADAKKARNLDRRREKFARKHGTDERAGAPPRDERPRPNRDWRSAEPRGEDQSRGGGRRPTDRQGAQGRTSGAPKRPWNQRHDGGEREPRRAWSQSGDAAAKRPREARTERPNAGKRPWNDRPAGGAPAKRAWDRPREDGARGPRDRDRRHDDGRAGNRQSWNQPRDARSGGHQQRDGGHHAKNERHGGHRPFRGDSPRADNRPFRTGPPRDNRNTFGDNGRSSRPAPRREDNRPFRPGPPRHSSNAFRDHDRSSRPGPRRDDNDTRSSPPGPRRDDNDTRPFRPGPPRDDSRSFRDNERSSRPGPRREENRAFRGDRGPRDGDRRDRPQSGFQRDRGDRDQPNRRPDAAREGKPDWGARTDRRPDPATRPWNEDRERARSAERGERSSAAGRRPFEKRGFERNQGTEEPRTPPQPRGPNREPRPSETPEPTPPPRPTEPVIPPPGPPERGRLVKRPRRP